jgi:hypothetical protein
MISDSDSDVTDFELEEFGIIDLSKDDIIDLTNDDVDVNPTTILWRDDIDHYEEIDGSLLLLEHRFCGAPGCLIVTQLDFCAAHLLEIGLCVKTSGVANAGFGLFATRMFKKKEKIAKFVGAPSKYNEHSRYLLSLCGDNYLDCALVRCAAACANTSQRKNNCTISHSRRLKLLTIEANAAIHAGCEIFISYGNSYSLKKKAETEA